MGINLKAILVMSISLTILGCATSTGPFIYSNINTSCIKGDVPNIFNLYSKGESFVYLMKIDDKPTQNPTYISCVAPGNHKVEIMVENDNRHNLFIRTIDIETEPNTEYQIKVYKLENGWEVNLRNIPANSMQVIGNFEFDAANKK